MTRTFLHSFDPPSAGPITGATVDLDIADIEDASIRSVLQTPGAAYGAKGRSIRAIRPLRRTRLSRALLQPLDLLRISAVRP